MPSGCNLFLSCCSSYQDQKEQHLCLTIWTLSWLLSSYVPLKFVWLYLISHPYCTGRCPRHSVIKLIIWLISQHACFHFAHYRYINSRSNNMQLPFICLTAEVYHDWLVELQEMFLNYSTYFFNQINKGKLRQIHAADVSYYSHENVSGLYSSPCTIWAMIFINKPFEFSTHFSSSYDKQALLLVISIYLIKIYIFQVI